MAILYGLSLGPGDPELITRKAWTLLNSDADWVYPVRKKGGNSYALDIVVNAGLIVPEDSQALVFPMTHNQEVLARYWLQAAEIVVNKLRQDRNVVFLVEGDASTFSTFQHLARTVSALDENSQVITIPGVTSFNAAAARAEMPLADTDDTVAIIPAGYGIEMIERLLDDFDTLVLLKVKPLLDDILDLLARRQLSEQACFIEKAGAMDEKVVADIQSLKGKKVNYLSLILVHNNQRTRGEMIRGCRKKSERKA